MVQGGTNCNENVSLDDTVAGAVYGREGLKI